ncbi:hypothetical protein IKF15_03400 [Candidatus Saccharibacteria bacterium]|nr:hypothetical protein [Candidatus Saccharibacteria bacterium]
MSKGRRLVFLTSLIALCLSLSCGANLFASSESTPTLSDEQIGLISQNCSSIKLQLQKIQRTDAKSRVNLGSRYERLSSELMLNLNLRLVKGNHASSTLAKQQTTFINERERFRNDYIGYSQALDSLIAIDCRAKPQKFYDQLVLTRRKRADIAKSMRRIEGIIEKHRVAVESLKEEFMHE